MELAVHKNNRSLSLNAVELNLNLAHEVSFDVATFGLGGFSLGARLIRTRMNGYTHLTLTRLEKLTLRT
jgi:hypothetical protein